MIKLPQKFEHRMRELLKEEFPDFLQGFEEERYGGVRFNSLKIQKEAKVFQLELRHFKWRTP